MTKVLELKVPSIDMNALTQQAKESAQKGAIEEIKSYYEGWDNPYRKAISGILHAQNVDNGTFCFPQIIGLINTALTAEIDRIVNATIAQTYIPMVTDILIGIEKELKLSEILEAIRSDANDPDEIYAEVGKDDCHDWYNLHLKIKKKHLRHNSF